MLFLLVILLFGVASAQDADCDFAQNVQPSTRYTIASLNYPSSYPRRARACRWIGNCPSGYQCRLDCVLELPVSSGCTGDRILISRTGDLQLNNAETYCGRQTLTVLSTNRNIVIGLITGSNSPGGRFTCDLTAQAEPPPPTPCVCGLRTQNRIVGGTQTGLNEYTSMVGMIDKSISQILCGAVIITTTYVMSAAHCVSETTPANIYLSIGNRNLSLGTTYNVNLFKTHPSYNPETFYADLALIRTVVQIQFSNTVTPVCLPFNLQTENLAGKKIIVTGWGTTSFGGPTTALLLQTSLNVISQQQCQGYKPTLTSRELCTLSPGMDACQFDSGGPCFLPDARTGRLSSVGIVSNGVACGTNQPSFNTRVTEFLDWIVNNASPFSYCVLPPP